MPSIVVRFLVIALLASNNGDWPTYGADYQNTRYVHFEQLNRSNVSGLVPVWTAVLGRAERLETTPIVVDRTMYVTTGTGNAVIALDAATGRRKWTYRPRLGPMAACCGLLNRGVAVANGRVFFATLDARLIALDARTGQLIWDTRIGSPAEGLSETMAPLTWGGLVFIGSSGSDFGLRGSLSAYHALNGSIAWRWYSVSPGWEGSYAPRVHGLSLHRDIAREIRNAEVYRKAWMHGGGAVWLTPAIDPKTGTIFVSTGNPSPVFDGSVRPGDNLFTDSIVAMDARSGRMRWAYQQTPHDVWEYEISSPPVLFEALNQKGKRVLAVGSAGKTRWFYVLDRRSGKVLRLSQSLEPDVVVYGNPPSGDPKEPLPLRGSIGPVSYDPTRHLIFFSSIDNAHDHQSMRGSPQSDSWNDVLAAINVDTGRIAWKDILGTYGGERGDALVAGSLSTPHLVFSSDNTGRLIALDPSTGTIVWRYALGSVVPGDASDSLLARLAHRLSDLVLPLKRRLFRQPAPAAATADVSTSPVSYQIFGRQYVAIGYNAAPERATAGAEISAFALPRQ